MARSIHARSSRRREDASRHAFREGQELFAVVEVELPETFQLTEPFGEQAIEHKGREDRWHYLMLRIEEGGEEKKKGYLQGGPAGCGTLRDPASPSSATDRTVRAVTPASWIEGNRRTGSTS